ncbi:HD-GYP domain-containing protein (c-di-GMP phosphodiesterase class II)/HAMP domain-containing protein [Pseudomonas sp. TE3786]
MPKSPRVERRYSLHVHISVLFTCLLLITGVVLGLFNYRQTTQVIFSSSNELFSRIQEDVQHDLLNTYQPIRHLLSLLALQESNQAADHYQRMALLPSFVQALRDNPKLASLYLGYDDGDFFMVRPLSTQALKDKFDAPTDAAYQVWTIDRMGESALTESVQSESAYYDAGLNLITRRQNLKERYDPRNRSWYSSARSQTDKRDEQITTAPYVFFSTGNVGTTLARVSGEHAVIAADLTLADLSATLAKHKITPSSEVVLYDGGGNAIAYPDSSRLIVQSDKAQLAKARDLSPVLATLIDHDLNDAQQGNLQLGQRNWVVSRSHLQEGGPQGLNLALVVPEDELLADAYRIRWQGALVTLAILLLCLPLGWLSSRLIIRPLRSLVLEAEAIRRFDFSHPASGHSPILEIDQLATSMARMKETISSFLNIASSLSAENRFDTLLARVLEETVDISGAQGGLIYLFDADSGSLEPKGLILDKQTRELDPYQLPSYQANANDLPFWLEGPAKGGASTTQSLGFDQAASLGEILLTLDSPRIHLAATGLHNRQGQTLGVLVLLQRDTGHPEDEAMLRPERIAFVEAVSGVAALCIESQRLLENQKKLLNAFIQLIAGAIDAKSPYTGGHCQRVPELTLMLARAAADSDEPPFAAYQPNEDQWEELHIAAWLHDCGKVTTPEYVVDKATKLETLYDRIHEVRTRFEVLKRDAWISYWQGVAGGGNEGQLAALRDELLAALDEEFAFVARCNLGGEAMAEADIERLGQIGMRTWTRTLDDRLGVSWEENQRQSRTPAPALPVSESLLADKPEHLFERGAKDSMPVENPWGFKLNEPIYKFNRGELYNLGVARGTLTAEERYIINNHIVQTILMLNHLPFPAHLANVAEIAGGHHEKMDGSGYPKRLRQEEMSLPARMMAIADIFEALTAVDRPYKRGKTLSEALNIMIGMCKGAHIDQQLFSLFVRSDVHMQYAQRFLQPGQIDEVDVEALLGKLG